MRLRRKRIQVLVQYKDSWGCNFLPYLEIDKNLSLGTQKNKLLNGLADKLEVNSKDLEIRHLEEAKCYSIKISVPEQEEKLFIHEFYTVMLSSYLEDGLLNRCKWMNIDTLADDINTVRRNSDVVDNLMRIKSRIVDSFVSDDSSKTSIKIIWNITSKCSFDCAICATYCEQKKELSESEKSKVLLAIMGMKDSIKELNFAGGDPLVSDDSKKIIKYAIEVMGKDKISVTTTGKAIGELPEIDKIVFLNNCILSLDTFDLDFKGVRKSVDYNRKNVRCSREFRRYMTKLRINVPIIVSAKYFNGLCCPKNESIIIIRKCKHFTSSSLARNDRCEHFTLSDLWRCAHEKQKNTRRRTIPSHHGMPSKWIDRSSMVCGTRHQTWNFLQLGKKAASERLCGFASVNRTQLSCTGKPGSCQSGFS